MRFGIHTMDEFDYAGKTVICRVDFNQPIDKATETLKSTHRIKAGSVTVKELSDKGARLVLLAHQGSDVEYKNYYCTRPHAKVLSEFIEKEVQWIDDVTGPAAREKIAALKDGEILLLDNVRFCAEEQTLFEQTLKLTQEQQVDTEVVRKLAPLADLYVNDAFAGAHRDQPSLCGFEYVLPSAMGRLFEKEYCVISEIMENPQRPCVFILGGAKIHDAFEMIETVLRDGTADKVLTGGLAGNILLLSAGYEIGKGSYDFIEKSGYTNFIERGKKLLADYADRLVLPDDLGYIENGVRKECSLKDVPEEIAAIDIGAVTIEKYTGLIQSAKTVFLNGPMGVFEQTAGEAGTKAVFEAMAETEAYTVIGGGDSVTAAKKYEVSDQLDYICTGGGALIRFLSGEVLPAVKALRASAVRFG